jgi:hypothetical protein
MKSHGFAPHHVALVVSSLRDPEQVAGAHTRAHAKEEAVYREAVEEALDSCHVAVTTFAGDELRVEATRRLPDATLIDATLKVFSHVVGTPWASGEKQASLGAWLVLPP